MYPAVYLKMCAQTVENHSWAKDTDRSHFFLFSTLASRSYGHALYNSLPGSNRIQNQPIALNFDIIYIIGFNIDIESTFKHCFIFELQLYLIFDCVEV